MNALRSISELSDQDIDRVRVAMADRYTAQPRSGDTQFWDLRLFGDGFEVLTPDPFEIQASLLQSAVVCRRRHRKCDHHTRWVPGRADPDCTHDLS